MKIGKWTLITSDNSISISKKDHDRLKRIEESAYGLIKELTHPLPDGNMKRLYQQDLETIFYGSPVSKDK